MRIKTILICLLIFIFRIIDLYTTQLGIKNFEKEEQNLIVKVTGMNMSTFFIMEIILAFLLIACYLLYLKNKSLFAIKAVNLNQYINLFFFNKSTANIKDWLTYFNFKKALVLFGSCIPFYIITTSILFCLNNCWAGLYNANNQTAIRYYLIFNDYYFFDFLIFIFPVIFLLFLLARKIFKEYKLNIAVI